MARLICEYSLYVRDLDAGVETWLHPCEKMLWENKLYKGDPQRSKSGLRSIKTREMYEFVAPIVKTNAEEVLFRYNSVPVKKTR